MSDSRANDALIAEKFFDAKFHPHTVSHDEQQFDQIDTCDLCGVPRHSHNSGIPRYSTDPATSKQLREKLAEDGYWSLEKSDEGTGRLFRFHYIDKALRKEFIEYADTEELAVVACALKMLAGEK